MTARGAGRAAARASICWLEDADRRRGRTAAMKIVTVLGTRPEIIRLSRVIAKLDALCEHVLVHTGQNYDPSLNDIFFRRARACARPTTTSASQAASFGEQIGQILAAIERGASRRSGPTALLILGDTNSGLAAFVAKRHGHPGLPHGGRQPLLRRPRARGGQPPRHRPLQRRADALHRAQPGRTCCARASPAQRIFVTGNPIHEVIDALSRPQIDASRRPRRGWASSRAATSW